VGVHVDLNSHYRNPPNELYELVVYLKRTNCAGIDYIKQLLHLFLKMFVV